MPLRLVDEAGDRERASIKDKKKKRIKTEFDKRPGPKSGFAPKDEPRTPKPMLSGGQAKLDKNKNNRIDAQDFKILRAEKAKGRGMGLQDEKMKPGKPMKAALGAVALGLGAKKLMKKKSSMATPGIGAAAAIAKKKKEILGKRTGGQMKKDPTKPVNPFAKTKTTPNKRKQFLKRMGRAVGKFGAAGAIVGAAAAGAKKIADKIKEKKNKKMGGGMMQRTGYNVGGSVTVKTKLGRNRPTKMY